MIIDRDIKNNWEIKILFCIMSGDFMSYVDQFGDFMSGDFMSGDFLTGYHVQDLTFAWKCIIAQYPKRYRIISRYVYILLSTTEYMNY